MNTLSELNELTIGELVAKDYRKADVFKKYGIDFCCGGKISVQQVCTNKGIDFEKLKSALLAVEQVDNTVENYDKWELDFLADYIVNKHHNYVNESLPVMLEYAQKVARVHGDHNPENIKILHVFQELASELSTHLLKEERILFPYIKELVKSKKENAAPNIPHFGTVKNPINMMEVEHDAAGDLAKQIKELSNDYTPPEYACNTYRVLYAKLEEFENDLHKHIHLENNILFPKAALLEQELLNN